jgi:hypothetical protein
MMGNQPVSSSTLAHHRHNLQSRLINHRPWTASGSSGDRNSGISGNNGCVAAETEALAAGSSGGNSGGGGGEMQARKVWPSQYALFSHLEWKIHCVLLSLVLGGIHPNCPRLPSCRHQCPYWPSPFKKII